MPPPDTLEAEAVGGRFEWVLTCGACGVRQRVNEDQVHGLEAVECPCGLVTTAVRVPSL